MLPTVDGGRDMLAVLDTALDVARAMLHLHDNNILHSDLKVSFYHAERRLQSGYVVDLAPQLLW